MNDQPTPESPIVPEQAPDHGPDFWHRVDAAIQSEAPETSMMPAVVEPLHMTATLPRVVVHPGSDATATAVATPVVSQSWARWPLAAAAAALVVLGLGFLVIRSGTDPSATTEIVAAPTDVAEAAFAGGEGDGQDGDTQDGEAQDGSTPTDQTSPDETSAGANPADATPAGADGDATNGTTADGDTTNGGDTSDGTTADGDTTNGGDTSAAVSSQTPTAIPPIPDFASARGATGEPDYVPLDAGLPADATFLANWPERGLTWYAVTDTDLACTSASYSEIRYVNGSGFTQLMRDPQLRFSGEISHFVVRTEQNIAAWVVACGEQLELHIATLEPTGRIADPTLVWLGRGSTSSALVLWESNEVSLNAIEPGGEAFAINYNIETGLLSRNGGPSRIMLEAGAPADRSLTPLAASPDGGLTYWQGEARPGTVSACIGLYGSGQSDMLWLRQGEGQWQPAAAGGFPVGTITAAALDSDSLQIAFADVCPGESGRVVLGTQLADGRIGDLTKIDLTPFVPGYAAQLFWVDDVTLRIETDNSEFGFGTVRFDYRLDEGLVVQLD